MYLNVLAREHYLGVSCLLDPIDLTKVPTVEFRNIRLGSCQVLTDFFAE